MDVDVIGAGALVNRLSRFNEDVYKVMLSEVKNAMADAADEIRVSVPDRPLRNWGTWNDGATRRGASQVGAVSISAFGGRDLGYNHSRVVSSIKFGAKKSRMRRVGVTGVTGWAGTSNAGASIFATAGNQDGRRGSTNSAFAQNLRRKHGNKYPRVLARVWVRQKDRIGGEIDAALNRAMRTIGL